MVQDTVKRFHNFHFSFSHCEEHVRRGNVQEDMTSNYTIYKKIENFFQDKPEVVAVYLFGSYAEKRERDFSDIDIGILINGTNEELLIEKRNTYMTKLGRILKKDIHPVIFSKDYSLSSPPL